MPTLWPFHSMRLDCTANCLLCAYLVFVMACISVVQLVLRNCLLLRGLTSGLLHVIKFFRNFNSIYLRPQIITTLLWWRSYFYGYNWNIYFTNVEFVMQVFFVSFWCYDELPTYAHNWIWVCIWIPCGKLNVLVPFALSVA